MPDETRGCPRCEGLVVMVAVACTHCGEFHRSGYGGRPAGEGSPCREGQSVFDVPAVLASGPTRSERASELLPLPARGADLLHRSAPPRMRTTATFTNGNGRGQPTPKALPPGRPAPARPAPQAPDPDRGARTKRQPPRRPLVQVIQEVLNRSAPRDLEPGTCVIVRNQFNGRWTPGFSVHEVLDDGYRVRRSHTGGVLPAVFVRSDVAADGSGAGAKLRDRAAAYA